MTRRKLKLYMATTATLDWEKELCDNIDKVISAKSKNQQYRLIEAIIEDVEDLIFTAYYKGTKNAKTDEPVEAPKRNSESRRE